MPVFAEQGTSATPRVREKLSTSPIRRRAIFGILIPAVFVVLLAAQSATTCRTTLRLIDGGTQREMPGILRITLADGTVHRPRELLCRGQGLPADQPISEWFVLNGEATIDLPRGRIRIEATRGLKWEMTRSEFETTDRESHRMDLSLRTFSPLKKAGWRSANTHLHLMKLTRKESDRYLAEIPRADDLDALFVSYLERAGADQDYITNEYSRDEIAAIGRGAGVSMGNGEEHRHNFEGFGQGYGHVMLLDLPELVRPVSIGPGIMKQGTDGLPLQRGIDQARRQKATIVWCHNQWGIEGPANFVTGRVHALNIFDGGPHGSFKDSYYRYWNAGIPVSFSTGTDWFQYDFSRVYARVDGDVTVPKWLDALRQGRTFITNGPLLTFTVNGAEPGETLAGKPNVPLVVEASAVGRADFGRIEVVRNGEVIHQIEAKPVSGRFEARATWNLPVDSACWLALRTPPPRVKDDPQLQEAARKNEFGQEIFAHTTPVSVLVNERRRFDKKVAEALLAEMSDNLRTIEKQSRFADDSERQRVLDVHRDGIETLRRRIDREAK